VRRTLLILISFVWALAVTVPAQSAKAASGCSGSMVVKTPSYAFALAIGPFAQMVTLAEAKAKHLEHAEVMVSGAMMGMHMAMSMQRHLEVHICRRSTGKVVLGAHPTITVADLTAKAKPEMVSVAAMYGFAEGVSDMHYGNNLAMMAGHVYRVTVTLGGQRAVFQAKVGKM
jgi:hypothetical protein